MSTELNEALVSEYLHLVSNEREYEAVAEVQTLDYVYQGTRGSIFTGPERVRALLAGAHQVLPDLELTVLDQIAEGDRVATRYRLRGTHREEWAGIKPTGLWVEFTGTLVTRFEKGRMAEDWDEQDLMGLAGQLGAGG